MPLALLLDVAGFNAFMAYAVCRELRVRVNRVVGFYIQYDVDELVEVVERLRGVYVGFALLDFVNGLPQDKHIDKQPLEIVMDNGAVDELITFFTDKNEQDLRVTFTNDAPTVWESEDLCRRVVRIERKKVCVLFSLVTI